MSLDEQMEHNYESPLKIEDFQNFLREKIGFLKPIKGGEEITTLCPWCEHKKFFSTVNHGHLYINIYSLKTNCYRSKEGCEAAGMIFKLINKLGGKVEDFLKDNSIVKNWADYSKSVKLKETFEIKNYEFESQKEELEKDDSEKIKYLHDRLGDDYDVKNIKGLILSPKKFILENNIPMDNYNFLDYLDENFIGFTGNRGSFLNFRNINYDKNNKNDIRYYNMKVNNRTFFKDFYGVKVGKIKKGMNTVVLMEGVFDLLNSVRSEELADLRNNSCFWACCFNKSYNNTLASVLDYCMLSRVNLVILSDSEVKESFYTWLTKNPFVNNIDVYWNSSAKDFGEKISNITKIRIEGFDYERKSKASQYSKVS